MSAANSVSAYLYRSLTHEQMLAIRRAARPGVTKKALAEAYSVSLRTIYRTLERDHAPVHRVTVGEWYADFEMAEEGPVRVSCWYHR